MKKLFDFGEALKALKGSCCVARQGWNEKGRFVCKQVPSYIGETIIPKRVPFLSQQRILS